MQTFSEMIKNKDKYTLKEDGVYSNIFVDSNGEFSTFAKAKKELVSMTKTRMNDFKTALYELKYLKEKDLYGEGEFFDVYYDGMYTTVERSTVVIFKTMNSAKKEARIYLKQRFDDWRDAWKRAVAIKKEDVEELP